MRKVATAVSAVLLIGGMWGGDAQARAGFQTTKPPLAAATPAAAALKLVAHNLRTDRAVAVDQALKIAKLDISVDIVGRLAQTTITATFANPGVVPLEGDFSLDLPAGATVSGYALDVHGVMTDGVLMPKFQAREAYEKKLRQGVDPGLAEITADNRFQTHVFPIFPGAGRTIRVTYVTPLGDDGRLAIPLATDEAVGQVRIDVLAHDQGQPSVVLAGDSLAFAAASSNAAGAVSAGAADHRLGGDLVINGLQPAAPVALSRHADGETYFELIVGTEPEGTQRAHTLRLYWDASRSRRDQDVAAEAQVVAAYVAKTAPVALDLVVFSDGAPRLVHFDRPTADQVAKALSGITYAGATRFDGLKSVLPGRADICLVVSDGAVDLGEPDVQSWPCRVLTLSSSKSAHRDVLGQLAARNGGRYADLGTLSPEAALALLTQRAPRFDSLTDGRGQPVDYILSPLGNDHYRLVGPAPHDRQLVLSDDHNETSYDFNRLPTVVNDAAGVVWGRAQVDRLNVADAPDADAVLSAARRYHVATPDVSFVVFETGRDYAEAGVAPPDTAAKDIQYDYMAERDRLAKAKQAEAAARLDRIVGLWNDEKTWWATKPLTLAQVTGKLAPPAKRPRPDAPVVQPRMTPPTDVAPPPPIPVPPVPQERHVDFSAPPPPPPPPPPPAPAMAPAPSAGYSAPPAQTNAGNGAAADTQVVVSGVRRSMSPAAPSPAMEISTAEWNPDRPYLKALGGVKAGDRSAFQAAFGPLDAQYGDTPAFYFDVAEWMYRHHIDGATAMARNTLDLPAADIDTQIMLASRLLRYGDGDDAVWLDEHIARLTPEKPQASRNLALALIEVTDVRLAAGRIGKAQAIANYKRALGLLRHVILTPWDAAYNGVEVISLMEANHLAAKLKGMGVSKDDLAELLPPALTAMLDVDIRITLEWNTDNTDMDLWVDEPSGERVIYNHPNSLLGGRLSNDMRRGYGPEEYLLRYAPKGDYKVLANIYAADMINRNGATNVTIHLYRDWGRPTEKVETFVTELKKDTGQSGTPVGSFRKN